MGLTEREADLDLRARYIRLLAELRRSRDHNPETLEAFERILKPEMLSPYLAAPSRMPIPQSVPQQCPPARQRPVAA